MDKYVYEVIILCAILHAIWNRILKSQGTADPLISAALFNGVAGLIGLPIILYCGPISASAYYFLIPSVVFGVGYTTFLMCSYKHGDMSQAYPLVRGTGILSATLIATLLFDEHLRWLGWIGVVVLSVGIALLSVRGGRTVASFDRVAVSFALASGISLGTTLALDGMGARASGNFSSYMAAVYMGIGVASVATALVFRGTAALSSEFRANWGRWAAAGTLAYVVYWVFIWATTIIPIPVAAGLRETSVLIGAAIAFVFGGESLHPIRLVAIMTILAGLILVRLSFL